MFFLYIKIYEIYVHWHTSNGYYDHDHNATICSIGISVNHNKLSLLVHKMSVQRSTFPLHLTQPTPARTAC